MSEYTASVDDKLINIVLSPESVSVNGTEYRCEILEKNPFSYLLRLGSKLYTVTKISDNGDSLEVLIDGNYYSVSVKTRLEVMASELTESEKTGHSETAVNSPMPGMVVKIRIKPGQEVKKGDSLLILEAMKMENDIKSPRDGKIAKILAVEGQSVDKGTKLVIIES